MNVTNQNPEKMSDNFIGIYPNTISKQFCDSIIIEIDKSSENSSNTFSGSSQYESELKRNDISLFADDTQMIVEGVPVSYILNDALQRCIELYAEEFFILKSVKASSNQIRLQKTFPRGGYHEWHCESHDFMTSRRCLAWMIYLNTLPDGEGETEFLWQGQRVQPQAGTCLIWPAAWTHTHRGNPVYTSNKYIATGWYTHVGG